MWVWVRLPRVHVLRGGGGPLGMGRQVRSAINPSPQAGQPAAGVCHTCMMRRPGCQQLCVLTQLQDGTARS